ncbi:cytochrome P450 [Aquipuribacter sp. MA13-6]|uniref:cytochrome P450 n=1 Tax=unclassified Aquipuribacter TaxID=2635084 RepID=UPI003EEFB5F6
MSAAGVRGHDGFDDHELWAPSTRRDPHPFWDRVRRTGGPVPQVDPSGHRLWVVAGYDDVLTGLHHPAIGHEVQRHAPPGTVPPPSGPAGRIAARQLIDLDPPDHTRLRRLVSHAFTSRTVTGLEPWVRDLSRRLVDRAVGLGRFDGVADLADPLPVGVIAQLVGVPPRDRPAFRAWSAAVVSGGDRSTAAAEQLNAYLDALARARREEPRDDLVSRLVAMEADGDHLDRDELLAMVQLLLVAGQETTVDVVANAVRLLLSRPEQWQALVAGPALAGAAVEETLRFRGPVEVVPPRWTFAEVRLGTGVVPAFERVGLSLWGANRDPSVFTDPGRFDVHRTDVGRHLALGHGTHFCLGAALGRLEARVMLETVARRVPQLQLDADPATLEGFRLHRDALPLRVPGVGRVT